MGLMGVPGTDLDDMVRKMKLERLDDIHEEHGWER